MSSVMSSSPAAATSSSSSSSSWNKGMLVHIAIEVVVIGIAAIFVMRKFSSMQSELDQVKQRLLIQEQRSQELMRMIQQLASGQVAPVPFSAPPQQQQRPRPPTQQGKSQPPKPSFSPPQQQPQQQQPQDMFRGMKSPLDTIMGILPAMMGGGSTAGMVITELQKPMPKPEVEVVAEEEDPDVAEALGKELPSITEEDEEDEKSA